jgi:radical SAM protein with 4Fe4S-binding SPASM domain
LQARPKLPFIDESGRVSPCSFPSPEYGIDVQAIRSAADLVALPARFRQARRAQRSIQCDDCLSTQVCDKFKLNPMETVRVSA